MKSMIQRLNRCLNSLLNHEGFLRTSLTLILSLLLVSTDVHEELCDLVSVLTRCWHFDGTSPVEVEVAQRVRQML